MTIRRSRISNKRAGLTDRTGWLFYIVSSPFCSFNNWNSDNWYFLKVYFISNSCLRHTFFHHISYSSPIIQEGSQAKQTEIQQLLGGFRPFIKSSLFYQFLIKQPSSQTPTKLIFWITVSELFFSINEARLSDLCHFTDSFICGRGVYEILQLPGSQWLCTDLHNSVCIPTPGGRNTAYITLPFSAS